MIAASPNWRSRSSSSVRLPCCFASDAARFVAVTVLPVPPLGENTVITRPLRPTSASRRRPVCRVEDDGEMTAGERAGAVTDVLRAPDELDLRVVVERLDELGEPVARA